MALAALLALSVLANGPATLAAHPPAGPHAVAAAVADTNAGSDEDDGDIPAGAPTDDYGFVAWCYGALDEYLVIYDQVKPDLKAIDKLFGTSVQEDEPYTADVAAERLALKRFADAIDAAERASPTPIATQGAADIQSGRGIWAAARAQTNRKLADAWLFWGIPRRCETTAKALKTRSTRQAHAAVQPSPSAIEIAAAEPAPTLPATAPAPVPAAAAPAQPAGPPPRAGAQIIDSK